MNDNPIIQHLNATKTTTTAVNDNEPQDDNADANTIVYYLVYPLQTSYNARVDVEKQTSQTCMQKVETEYVPASFLWQEEAFMLTMGHEMHPPPVRIEAIPSAQRIGRPYLHGQTRFGDNIEDEWLIVSLLMALSEQDTDCVAFMEDDDGEFLAIEAAEDIPDWLNPENTTNKLAIHEGLVHIIPPQCHHKNGHLDIGTATDIIRDPTVSTEASQNVQWTIRKRLYLENVSSGSSLFQERCHQAHCTVPRPVAEILRHRPQLLAPAVTAFYTRDAIDVKACNKMHSFPLGDADQDFVTVPVKFTQCLYAQLRQQRMHLPKIWQRYVPPEEEQQGTGSWLNGMKLTCGFEILVARGPAYHLFQARTHNGVESFLENQKQHFSKKMLRNFPEVHQSQARQDALSFYGSAFDKIVHQGYSTSAAQPIVDEKGRFYKRLLPCPNISNTEWLRIIQRNCVKYDLLVYDLLYPELEYGLSEKSCPQLASRRSDFGEMSNQTTVEDDDQWLQEGAQRLEQLLNDREKEMKMISGDGQQHNTTDDMDGVGTARAVIDEMNSFVNRMSGYEGISNQDFKENDEDNDNDQHDTGSSPPANERNQTSRLGAHPDIPQLSKQLSKIYSKVDYSKLQTNHREDDSEWEANSCRSQTTPRYCRRRNLAEDLHLKETMHSIFESMDTELGTTTMKESFSKVSEGSFTDETNANFNLVKNLARSVGNQAGLAGPASNMLQDMGITPPADWFSGRVADEDESEQADESYDPSSERPQHGSPDAADDIPESLKRRLELLD